MKNRNKKLRIINVNNNVYKWLLSDYSKELKIWFNSKMIYNKRQSADLIVTPKVVEEIIINLK